MYRKDRGFSQMKLAELSGLHPQTIRGIEQNKAYDRVALKTAYKLANALDCYIEDLIEEFNE